MSEVDVEVLFYVHRNRRFIRDGDEIKTREVSWTLTKKLYAFTCPGEIKRS